MNYKEFLRKAYGNINITQSEFAKSDDPILSSTAAYANVIYGARAFLNVSVTMGAFAVTPKDAYTEDGMRLVTATGTKSTGIAENAALPDTDMPDLAEVTVGFKEEMTTFEVTRKAIIKAKHNDYADLNRIMNLEARLHLAGINGHMLTDADTLAGDNVESWDRVTISEAAVAALSYTAGDNDMYGLNISSATYFDPLTYHNSGTDRDFDFAYVYTAIGGIMSNAGVANWGLTKPDTMAQMNISAQTQVRFMAPKEVSITMTESGPQVSTGQEAGVVVTSINGCPMYFDASVAADGIGRIYLADVSDDDGSPKVALNVAEPTRLDTADNAVLLDAVKQKSAYYTALELRARQRFQTASIRDMQTVTP